MKKLFSTFALLASLSLIVGCKNSGKGSSEKPDTPDIPDAEPLVLPHSLEEASIMEFKHMKQVSSKDYDRLDKAMGYGPVEEGYGDFANISEINFCSGNYFNALFDPAGSYEEMTYFIDVKVFSNDYSEVNGSFFEKEGDKNFSLEKMQTEKIDGQCVVNDDHLYVHSTLEYFSPYLTQSTFHYSWETMSLDEGVPSQLMLFSRMSSDGFNFLGSLVGYQEINGLTYFNFYSTSTSSSSYTYGTYHYTSFYQTVVVIDQNDAIQGMYDIYEEWFDHDILSGEYGMYLSQKTFSSLEVKRNPIPTCDSAKRSAFIESIPYYYVTESNSFYSEARFDYRLAAASLDSDGKLTAAPSFPTGTNYVNGTSFVDNITVGIRFRPSISSYGEYFALDLKEIKVNYLSLKGPTAGTQETKTYDVSNDATLKAAIAEITGGKLLKYSDVEYLVIPRNTFEGFVITASAVDPTSSTFGVASYPEDNFLLH